MPRSLAQTLPVDVLLQICRLAAADHPSLFAHGGKLLGARWDSHEAVHPLTLVCKRWHAAASKVLYDSVAVLGGEQARLFLRSLAGRPALGAEVRRLVVGLADPEDEAELDGSSSDREGERTRTSCEGVGQTEDGARADSAALAEVLTRCHAVEHLQIRRALHQDTRAAVLPVLVSRPFVTLICAPCWLQGDGARWTRHFHQPEDVVRLVTPSLRFFEFEFAFAFPSGNGSDENDRIQEAIRKHLLPDRLPNLRGLRLDGGVPPTALELVLSRTSALAELIVYTERAISANTILGHLSTKSAAAIRRLR